MGWKVAMESNFTLNADIDLLSKDILNGIKEKHSSAIYLDKTIFWGENSRCHIDTYQVYSPLERGNITINIFFYNRNLENDLLLVKVSAFPPIKNTSLKCKKHLKEIEELILSHK